MFPAPKSAVIVVPGATVATNATASGTLDTLGYDFAVISVVASASNTASNNFSVLKLEEGDTTSSFAAITEFTGDGTGGFTIATASTNGEVVAQFRVDCRARKRYLKLSCTPGTTQIISASANLFRGDEVPVTATAAGCGNLVEG